MISLDLITFVLLLSVALLFFIDEEPMFDFTDLNVLHVVLLFIAAASCFFDNACKLQVGLGAHRDRVVFTYMFAKGLVLVLYFLLIWGVFSAHLILPLLKSSVNFFFLIYMFKFLKVMVYLMVIMMLGCVLLRLATTPQISFSSRRLALVLWLYLLLEVLEVLLLLANVATSRSYNLDINATWSVQSSAAYASGSEFIWHETHGLISSKSWIDFVILFAYTFIGVFYLFALGATCLVVVFVEDMTTPRAGLLYSLTSAAVLAVSALVIVTFVSYFVTVSVLCIFGLFSSSSISLI